MTSIENIPYEDMDGRAVRVAQFEDITTFMLNGREIPTIVQRPGVIRSYAIERKPDEGAVTLTLGCSGGDAGSQSEMPFPFVRAGDVATERIRINTMHVEVVGAAATASNYGTVYITHNHGRRTKTRSGADTVMPDTAAQGTPVLSMGRSYGMTMPDFADYPDALTIEPDPFWRAAGWGLSLWALGTAVLYGLLIHLLRVLR